MALQQTRLLSSLLLAGCLATPSLVSAACYWQNSTLAPDSPLSIAPDDTACFPDQDNSACCGTGWTCLSDGVCYIEQANQAFYYRGTCTDRTWNSQQCPGWCFNFNSNMSIPLRKCSDFGADGWYCCYGDPECSCSTGRNAIKLGASQPTTVTVIGSTSWPGFVATSSRSSTSALASNGTTTTNIAQTSTSKAESAIISDAGSASSSPSADPQASSSGSSNTGLAAGLGAGLGVAAILIATLVFFLMRSRRRRRAQASDGGAHVSLFKSELSGHVHGHGHHNNHMLFAHQDGMGRGSHTELPAMDEHARSEMAANGGAHKSGGGVLDRQRAELGS